MILQVWSTFLLWVSPIRLWLAHRSDTNRHMDALRHGHHVSVAKPGRSKWRWNGGVVKTARWRKKKQRWFMICDFVGVVFWGKRLIQKASWLLFGLHRFLCDKVGQLLEWMDMVSCCWKFTSNKVYEMCYLEAPAVAMLISIHLRGPWKQQSFRRRQHKMVGTLREVSRHNLQITFEIPYKNLSFGHEADLT